MSIFRTLLLLLFSVQWASTDFTAASNKNCWQSEEAPGLMMWHQLQNDRLPAAAATVHVPRGIWQHEVYNIPLSVMWPEYHRSATLQPSNLPVTCVLHHFLNVMPYSRQFVHMMTNVTNDTFTVINLGTRFSAALTSYRLHRAKSLTILLQRSNWVFSFVHIRPMCTELWTSL